MFWALVLESGEKYLVDVKKPLHISKAVLDIMSVENSRDTLSVVCYSGEEEFMLCHLSKHQIPQESLDLMFSAGSKIVFECRGKGSVHLTGYYLSEEKNVSVSSVQDKDDSMSNFEPRLVEGFSNTSDENQAVVSPVSRKSKRSALALLEDLKSYTDSDSEDTDYNYNADLLRQRLKNMKRQTKTSARRTYIIKEDADIDWDGNNESEPNLKSRKCSTVFNKTVTLPKK